jgi:hypothetical protein
MVRAEHQRGDPLRDLRRGQRIAIEPAIRMVVDVDEPGREHETLRVDHAFARLGLEIADLRNAIARDAHADLPQGGTGSIRDLRVRDDGAGLGVRREGDQGGTNDQRNTLHGFPSLTRFSCAIKACGETSRPRNCLSSAGVSRSEPYCRRFSDSHGYQRGLPVSNDPIWLRTRSRRSAVSTAPSP